MQNFPEVLILSIIGAALLFGFTIYFRSTNASGKNSSGAKSKKGRPREEGPAIAAQGLDPGPARAGRASEGRAEGGAAGKTRPCPICSALLNSDEPVSSVAFPSQNGQDRLMHIRGCPRCLRGEGERICPACKQSITIDEILICRLFERSNKPIGRIGPSLHVHVLGCSNCRGPGNKVPGKNTPGNKVPGNKVPGNKQARSK